MAVYTLVCQIPESKALSIWNFIASLLRYYILLGSWIIFSNGKICVLEAETVSSSKI